MSTGADWLLEALAAEGVRHLIGNPGSTELPITDAAGRQRAVRYVLALHEASVMGIADGYAQVSGSLAAVNVHVQPGLANAMSGILNAARARVPVLVTVGQQVQDLLPGGAVPRGGAGGAVPPPRQGGLGGRPAPATCRACWRWPCAPPASSRAAPWC